MKILLSTENSHVTFPAGLLSLESPQHAAPLIRFLLTESDKSKVLSCFQVYVGFLRSTGFGPPASLHRFVENEFSVSFRVIRILIHGSNPYRILIQAFFRYNKKCQHSLSREGFTTWIYGSWWGRASNAQGTQREWIRIIYGAICLHFLPLPSWAEKLHTKQKKLIYTSTGT